jgi:hypothetical protein
MSELVESQSTVQNIPERNARGRFVKGNCGGPGNPNARRVGQWKRALTMAITPADIRAVVKKMIERALKGDVSAAKLILDRALGVQKAVQVDELELNSTNGKNGITVRIVRDTSDASEVA